MSRETRDKDKLQGWCRGEEEGSAAIRAVRKGDPAYPPQLLPYERMPDLLYVAGRLPDPAKKSVAIVGARACSAYGRAEAGRFARALAAAGVQIISGLAHGIDRYAHEGALEAGGKTWAVLGCGADICYPKENLALYEAIQQNGGLLTEFPPGVPPVSWHFPIRNRIISALADLILVIEARARSGSLITADYGLEQGKSVWAVPGKNADALSQGCNRLISQGAGIALDPEFLLEELGVTSAAAGGKSTSGGRRALPSGWKNRELAEQVLDLLGIRERSLQDLRDETGADAAELYSVLTQLCLYGFAEEVMLGYYGAR